MFRVIIAGGRDFDDYQLLKATMDKLLCNITDEITVVCGQAKGADTLGEQYAMEKGYAIDYYPAQWKLYGKRYECVCLVGTQYLVVLSANHIPQPESAEQKDWWKDVRRARN